jgi:dolichyl-phosphate beta-glucosyltransferase
MSAENGNKALVSYIIPAYQAESFIYDKLKLFLKYCSASDNNTEVIVVNDGSSDGTDREIKRFIRENNDDLRIKYVNLHNNSGKGGAVKKGFEAAEGKYIVFTDCDLPYSFNSIKKVEDCLINKDAAFCIADRMHNDSTYLMRSELIHFIYVRHTAGRLFNWFVNVFSALNLEDTQAGLKGFDRATAEIIFKKMTIEDFTFDVDLLTCAKIHNKKILSIPVDHIYESEMSTVNFIKHTFIMFIDLFRILFKRVSGYYTK